jgi:hypothetical protein
MVDPLEHRHLPTALILAHCSLACERAIMVA